MAIICPTTNVAGTCLAAAHGSASCGFTHTTVGAGGAAFKSTWLAELAELVEESLGYDGRKLVAPTAPYPWEATVRFNVSVGASAAMGTLAVKLVSVTPGLTVTVPISGAALPSVCVMDTFGLVPNDNPVTLKICVVPACHETGETAVTAGVGSPTVKEIALLVPATVITVMLCGPTLLACPSTL